VKQEWVCEVCGLNGAVQYREDAGVFEVVYAIEDHHNRLAAQYAPHCHFDVHKVRVKGEDVDEYEWNRLVASLERGNRV